MLSVILILGLLVFAGVVAWFLVNPGQVDRTAPVDRSTRDRRGLETATGTPSETGSEIGSPDVGSPEIEPLEVIIEDRKAILRGAVASEEIRNQIVSLFVEGLNEDQYELDISIDEAAPFPSNRLVINDSLLFNSGSDTVDFTDVLNLLYSLLERTDWSIIVTGHTDNVGPDGFNQGLSERRASAVAEYFVGQGLDAARVNTRGAGETSPREDNGTEEGRAANRRIEIEVIPNSSDQPGQ